MRNVRPSFVRVSADNKPAKGTGPRSRDGELSATFYAREFASAVPFLSVEAVAAADKATVLWRVTDLRTGRIIHEESIAQ